MACGFADNNLSFYLRGLTTNCYFAGELNGGNVNYFGNSLFGNQGELNGEITNTYYKTGCMKSGNYSSNDYCDPYINGFTSFSTLPNGYDSSEWTLVNGLPELNIFL